MKGIHYSPRCGDELLLKFINIQSLCSSERYRFVAILGYLIPHKLIGQIVIAYFKIEYSTCL